MGNNLWSAAANSRLWDNSRTPLEVEEPLRLPLGPETDFQLGEESLDFPDHPEDLLLVRSGPVAAPDRAVEPPSPELAVGATAPDDLAGESQYVVQSCRPEDRGADVHEHSLRRQVILRLNGAGEHLRPRPVSQSRPQVHLLWQGFQVDRRTRQKRRHPGGECRTGAVMRHADFLTMLLAHI